MNHKGKRIGYIRVSTTDQNPDRQLVDIPLDKKFIEYASGKDLERPQLQFLLEYMREDDELYVHSTDRLARSVRDLHHLVDLITEKKVTVNFVKNNLIFSGKDSPMSKFQLSLLGALAEFEREIILERQREGIAQAKRMGKYKGRKSKFSPDVSDKIKTLMETRDPKSKIAQQLQISRYTLYRYLEKMKNSNIERPAETLNLP